MFTFSACGEYFAFKTDEVQEVTELRKLVIVPKSLGYIKGVINFKGILYCIIDTASFFGLEPRAVFENDIIILSDEQYKVGFLADKVIGDLDQSKAKAADESAKKEDFVISRCQVDGYSVRLLDTGEIFKYIEESVYNRNFVL